MTEEIEFPVDAGTVESVVPARILRRLGIKPLSDEECHLSGKISG